MGKGRKRAPPPPSTNSDDGEETEPMEGMETDDEDVASESDESPSGGADVDTSDPVIHGLRASMDNILQLVTDILPTCSGDEEKKKEVVHRMKTSMLQLIRSEVNYLEGLKIVDRVTKERTKVGNDADDQVILSHCEQLKNVSLEKIADHRNNLKDQDLMKHINYKRLEKEIQDTQRNIEMKNKQKEGNAIDSDSESQTEPSYADLEDDDTESVEMIPTVDPITKQPLTDPIRNRHCRHIYGKASILAMLQNHRKTRCPTLGCSNRKYVIASDLVEDPELRAKVQKKLQSSQKSIANRTQREQNTID